MIDSGALPLPLAGIRVLDFSALGPGPFASMMLADFGASVLSLRRPGGLAIDPSVGLAAAKDVLEIDLSGDAGRSLAARLAREVDVVLESFRPGVMERLGLGPEVLMTANPRLVYARLTGWGQQGAYADRAGHDINYLAIAGILAAGGKAKPSSPPALLGDLANGSYPAVIGIAMALFARATSGTGRLIDCAITDSATYMLSAMFAERRLGFWSGEPVDHVLAGNAPFYGTYRCADGRWFAVGAIETKFYDALLTALGLGDESRSIDRQMDRAGWPDLRQRIAARFLERSRDEWTTAFEGYDACATPVLEFDELEHDAHLVSRGNFVDDETGVRPASAPRFSGTGGLPHHFGRRVAEMLRDYGIDDATVAAALAGGVIREPSEPASDLSAPSGG